MAYVEVTKDGKLVTRRLVDDAEAMKGCRIRLGSAGKVILKIGESKVVGKYEVSVHEGMPSDDAHKAVDGLSKSGDSFPEMSATETASMEDVPGTKSGDSRSAHPVIEGYQIVGKLGEGGMGTVWRAVQLSTKREVALKFMGRHRFASDKARARFEREVALAAKLTHPNIARVYHSGIHRGVYYYAMELVDGVHLDKYVQQNLPTQQEILELTERICDAIQHAHTKGIVHRDLKPSNILITKDGQPHIVDFGLAKASEKSESDLTISIDGELAGTLAYMAPEQAAGRMDQISVRTDVYSLGVILYRLVTGESPHDLSGSRYDTIKNIVEEDIVAPRELNSAIDADLEWLILSALEKEPDNRYPSAGILRQDIRNYLNGEPLLARSMSTTYLIRKGVRKRAKPIAMVLSLAIVLVAIITVAWCLVSSERKKRLEAERLAGLDRPYALQESDSSVDNAERESIEDVVLTYQLGWNSLSDANAIEETISDKAYVACGQIKKGDVVEAFLSDKTLALHVAKARRVRIETKQETYVIRSIFVSGSLAYAIGRYGRLDEYGTRRAENIHFLAKDDTGWKIISQGSPSVLREVLEMQQDPLQISSKDKQTETTIRHLMDRINDSWAGGTGAKVLEEVVSDSAFACAMRNPDNPSEAAVFNKQTFCWAYGELQRNGCVERHEHQVEFVGVLGPVAYEIGTTSQIFSDGREDRHRIINYFGREQARWKLFFSASADDLNKALGISLDEQIVRLIRTEEPEDVDTQAGRDTECNTGGQQTFLCNLRQVGRPRGIPGIQTGRFQHSIDS